MSGPAGIASMVNASAGRALAFLKAMQIPRSVWPSSILTPDDPAFLRTSSGAWTGTYGMPSGGPPVDTPILVEGPLWFPIVAGQEVTFSGLVDAPWGSMEGFASAGWGPYAVIGKCGAAVLFRVPVGANRSWSAIVANPPAGAGWSFQLVDDGDVPIGAPWDQDDHPGDARAYWAFPYSPPAGPILINVSNAVVGAHNVFSGDVSASFAPVAGRHYRVIVTEEVDVEYVQLIADVAWPHFQVTHDLTFTGKLKTRLIEYDTASGAPIRHIGPVWDQDNAADASGWLDMRVEYWSIDAAMPGFPTRTQPAKRDLSWSIAHTRNTIGRVRLVDINTKRVFGEYTMPSGLARSYNVPAADAGQSTGSIYYDGFLDTCFLYDQAVMLIGLIQQGEWTAAQHLIDALLLLQNDGGSFPFAASQFILTSNDYTLLRTGAIAWVVYALLIADRPEYRAHWTTRTDVAATDGLKWIINNTLNSVGLFKGGFDQSGTTPWWSTEHNLDAWWCLDLADTLYGSADYNWRFYADGVKAGLLNYGWDSADGIFWQGGGHTDDTVNDGAHALDMMSWGGVALEKWGRAADRDHAIARAYQKYYVTDNNFHLSGFCTFIPEDGYPADTVESPWCEGTFGMVLALRNSDPKRAFGLIATMARGQMADGSYRYTLQRDPIEPIETFPCLIGAAWNVLALSGAETPNHRILWV